MTRWALAFWLLMLAALAGVMGYRMVSRQQNLPASTAADHAEEKAAGLELTLNEPQDNAAPPHAVAPFSLTERSGKTFDSAALTGEVWVASFFFTACPGACLKLNHAIADLQKDLTDPRIRFVSITVDPGNDTPQALAKYADLMHADPEWWLFVTGSLDDIKRIARESFQVSVERVTHSDRMLLVDRQGRIRGSYRGTDDNQVRLLKKKLAELLAEPA